MTDLGESVEALDRGELVVFPTDTVFGVGACPDVPGATSRIFDAKRRPRDLTLPILAADAGQARGVAAFDERAERLAERFWPGPLTIVLPRTEVSRPWDLGEERHTVGLRIPDHPVALRLLRERGPLAATSANLSGEPTAADCAGVRGALGEHVAVYLCDDPPPKGIPSTVVDLTGRQARVLREGAVPGGEVLQALG